MEIVLEKHITEFKAMNELGLVGTINYTETLTAGASMRLLLRTGDKVVTNISIITKTSQEALFKSYSGVTASADGTAPSDVPATSKMTMFARNGLRPRTFKLKPTYAPTVTNFGAVRGIQVVPGGRSQGIGSSIGDSLVTKASPNGVLLLEMTNTSNQSGTYTFVVDFYEKDV